MCGISGFVGSWVETDPDDAIARMTDTMRHRGPDGRGTWRDAHAALGHRRLSIIDLSQKASQPMVGPSGAVITFNGEIYNYQELRRELALSGEHFHTDSDTEVLLRLWERHGPSCLDRLVGMFAFAVWTPASGTLFLARDRLGKKPLYYCHSDRGLAFASEPKALLALPAVAAQARIDPLALSDFLSLGYILSPKSAFTNIRRLPAAHCATFKLATNTLELGEYWHLEEFFHAPKMAYDQTARDRFEELLTDAVRLRLRSDVPVGVFLSGGMDSSAVAAVMASMDQTATRAFCVGFTESSYDESIHARHVAEHLGIPITHLANPAAEPELLSLLMAHTDEPFADTSIMPTYQLNRSARHHVTVALTGDGADEILAGYPTYRANAYHSLIRHLPKGPMRGVSRLADYMLRPRYRKVGWDYKVRQFLRGHPLPREQAHYSWRQIFSEADKRRLVSEQLRQQCRDYDPFASFDAAFARVRGLDFLDQCLYVDVKTWLQDDILVKADRASMAASLEVRSPFLDHRLVEFTAQLPTAAKMDRKRQKIILKDIMAKYLPGAIIDRRKAGFNAPTHALSCTGLPPACAQEWFNPNFHLNPALEDVTFKSFSLATLGAWLQLFTHFEKTGNWENAPCSNM